MILSKLFNEFFRSEKTGGLILILVTVASLIAANSGISASYMQFWNTDIAGHSLTHWINDGLMTIFFLLIGLELERELYEGELKNIKNAALPIFAAIGGMLVPASIYSIFNFGTPLQSGAGIAMATDIAFAIGVLSILGNRVPASLKVFLAALAVIDDLGSIIVIAVFYTSNISILHLSIALGIYAILIILNRLKVCHLFPYIIGGIAMWYFVSQSGIHATITGVLLAFAIPFGKNKEKSPSNYLEHLLHKPVAFFILPVFAMANTGIALSSGWTSQLTQPLSIGIIAAMLIGKPLGITFFSYWAVKLKIASLPRELKWGSIIGTGLLGGIGFTMSIFVTLLAFTDIEVINNAKIAILVGSSLAGMAGLIWLSTVLKSDVKETD